ncbi:hypothetical protein Tco_0804664 [Tanacetum coccineum]|uniref:Reverse transcriptase domain-containing protein n=1 Tax=Tanacetum coccineum TaxID=301880 RepID=A0ABQ5A7T8_9ASTR
MRLIISRLQIPILVLSQRGESFARTHVSYLKKHPKWDAPKPLDADDHTEIFGPRVRPRPPGKPRPAKKTKSETTESSGGSQSGFISESLSEDLRRKLQATESAYEEKKEKELAYMECKELEFLMIDAEGDHPKAANKGEASEKEKAPTIFMVQPWERVTRQKTTQSFSLSPKILFPPLENDGGEDHPMVIQSEIGGHLVHRMYMEGGSAFEVLYEHCFNRLRPKIKSQMIPATTLLLGFNREISWLLGQISLLVSLGDKEHSTSVLDEFHGVVTLQSSRVAPIECRMVIESLTRPDPKTPAAKGIKMAIHPEYPDQTFTIGGSLIKKERMELCDLLKSNLDVFSWKLTDMTRVPQYIVEHLLNIREGCSPIRQKKRGQALDRNKAINEEVSKLVEADIMREVHYHNWL